MAYQTDKPALHFLDDERRAQQEYLDSELPGRLNRPVSHSRDETRWVVQSSNDKDNEWHGFLNEENQFDFYRAMERFFAKNLGL